MAAKHEAVRELLNTPVGERSEELIAVAARELEMGDLVKANAQVDDPVVIPALPGALGTGRLAVDGMVRFGSLAVPGVANDPGSINVEGGREMQTSRR